MKLNGVNKIYIAIALILITGIIYNTLYHQSWNRYYYAASACAPSAYPVHTRNLYFVDKQGELISINTEEVNSNFSKWGQEYYFSETNTKELLPQTLVIEYVSYPDSVYYYDSIPLPKALLDSSFKSLIANKETVEIYNRGNHPKGLTFLIGIANNGNIAIFLRGKNKEILLTKVKLKPKGSKQLEADGLNLKDFFNSGFEFMDDSIKVFVHQEQAKKANYIDSPTYYLDTNHK